MATNEDHLCFIYTPDMFMHDVDLLCNQLANEKFDLILTIARGGLVLSAVLANYLDIQEIHTIQLKSYIGQSQKPPVILHEPNWLLLQGKNVLVVDDLIDHGTSMLFLKELLLKHEINTYKVAVLIDKQKNPFIRADYAVRVLKDWIHFFWEKDYNEHVKRA
jgi:hypoxanthine phosphoribosyltransferase